MNQTDSWARCLQGKHLITAARFLGHRGIQERDIMANVPRNAIIVSVLPYYDVGDRQEMGVSCRLLETVKDI